MTIIPTTTGTGGGGAFTDVVQLGSDGRLRMHTNIPLPIVCNSQQLYRDFCSHIRPLSHILLGANYRPSTNFYSLIYSLPPVPKLIGISNLVLSWDIMLLNGRWLSLSLIIYINIHSLVFHTFPATTKSTAEEFETCRLCSHHENNNFYVGGGSRYVRRHIVTCSYVV